jgi:RNA polymerase sigma factor (sigma-70 family)
MASGPAGKVLRHLRAAALAPAGSGPGDGPLLQQFVARRDEAAFAALLRRHGPMVLGVCRRLLRHEQDAEDAFQATFLVLARRAAAVAPPEMVGNWLYGVAYQTARKARATRARRHARERQVTAMPEREAPRPGPWRELRPLFDRELRRLPDNYRAVLVLCDLEGKTRKEAARLLGWPEGSVCGRLARARQLLAGRLARQGVTLPAAALAAVLTENAAPAAVPAALADETVRAAGRFAAGTAAAGVVSARVVALTEGVLRTMLLSKLTIAVVGPLVLVALGLGISGLTRETRAAGPAPAARSAPPWRDEGNLKEMLLALEGRIWEAHRKQDLDTFKNLLADDFVGQDIFGSPYGKAGTLDYVVKFRVLEYAMKDVRVVLLNATSAIVTYEIRYQVRPTNGPGVESTARRVTAAWARRQGRWWYVYCEDNLVQKKEALPGGADVTRVKDLDVLWKSGRLNLKPPGGQR